ncbi:AI-2E family transporter [Oculatella sp. LEGE 06141]|uniref:AI-2E family transporter n=1 Tax=Oculatella sp. LEGE 06141 TaxID=1828648 RepID=UPI001882D339|nr:AI-2E family transporter [Oculatella sp. LEGE 06141]MBE9180754.1 AI-2E family transporter [Oculatella sp. LEGE 06141]
MNDSSAKTIWERVNNIVLIRFLLLFASGWAIVQFLNYFRTVVIIFITATILAFLLNYPVRWLKRVLPHGLAVSFIFLISLVLIGAVTFTVGLVVLSQGQRLLESLSDFLNSLAPVIDQAETFLQSRNIRIDLRVFEEQLRDQALVGLGSGLSVIQILLANFINLIFTAVVAFFMLLDGDRLWNFTLRVVPLHSRERFNTAIQRNLLGFFWGQLLLALFFSGTAFIVFLMLQVPFALVLAVIVGMFDLIPGIGATLGIGLVCLILLSQSVWLALKVLIACVLLQQVQENLVLPRVMQNSLNINPVVMFFALLVGARVAGVFGLFLAVPLAGVIVSLLEIEAMQSRAIALAREPSLEEFSQK